MPNSAELRIPLLAHSRRSSSPDGQTLAGIPPQGASLLSNQTSIDATIVPIANTEPDSTLSDIALSWADDTMKAYFAGGSVLYIAECIKHSLSLSRAALGIGAGWNFIDAIGALIEAFMVWVNAHYQSQRDADWERIYAGSLGLSSAFLIGGTTATLLATQGIIVGAAAATCLPLASISFAVAMWVAFGRAVQNLVESSYKQEPIDLMIDRITQCERTNKQLLALQDELHKAELAGHPTIKLEKEQAMLCKRYVTMQHQAAALARTIEREQITSTLYERLESISQPGIAIGQALDTRHDGSPSEADTKLVTFLTGKQRQKTYDNWLDVATWGFAAIGMTLVAVSFVCPPLFIAGAALSLVAGGLKLYQMHQKHTSFAIQEQNPAIQNADAALKKMASDQRMKDIDVPTGNHGHPLSSEQRQKLYTAYQLVKTDLRAAGKAPSDFFNWVMRLDMTPGWFSGNSQFDEYLDKARDKAIEREVARAHNINPEALSPADQTSFAYALYDHDRNTHSDTITAHLG